MDASSAFSSSSSSSYAVDSSPALLWMSGVDGMCSYVNRTWLNFRGSSLQKEKGVGWLDGVHPDDAQMVMDKYSAAVNARANFQLEYRMQKKDGTYVWVLNQGFPRLSEGGEFLGYVGCCLDITEKKEAEAVLRSEKLQAETANKMKSGFLAVATHEIREALGALLGFSEMLSGGDLSRSEKEHYRQSVRRKGAQLSQIINSITDLSKIETGELEVKKADVNLLDLLNEVIATMSLQALEKNVVLRLQFEHNLPRWIYTDGLRLKEILINVIDLAIKYTTKGEVVVEVSPEAQDLLSFVITDTGRGMTVKEQKAIFNPFQSAELELSEGSVGLGLILARNLAQSLGGNVELLFSEPGKGSKFKVTLVRSPSLHKDKMESAGSSMGGANLPLKGMKLLVVDDVKDNQDLVSRYLKKVGVHDLDFAENGAEAVEKARKQDYDCILMDLQMPVMDGLEATKTLRKDGYKKPIWAVTAYALREERDKCLAEGFDDHFAKPIDRKTLIGHLENLKKEKESDANV
ncbi:response regulator [Bdellovibrio sp. 22V]|uniref:PAS domain-containing sensor histidine kinase n=1 Tax=Bdellovibrio TaxID=958 RepID=UPI002542F35A|nr:PAS domain-containing hybrid sensor histidine kinase/response regulator [Bdellovibrio sp. 22V]WII73292.1 response regulator [Bdellovibrio sp. 22V]